MNNRKCNYCGAGLDPEEKCNCRLVTKLKELKLSGELATLELSKEELTGIKISKVKDLEVIVKDPKGRISAIDLDSVKNIEY